MTKWIMNGTKYDNAAQLASDITDRMDDSVYDEMLDECYGEIEICGISYSASIALYRVDEIAYNCGRNDYYDSLSGDIEYELERMDDGEEQDFYGVTVECVEEEEEEEEEEA